MGSAKQKGLSDQYVSPAIHQDEEVFDASAFSFFGNLQGVDDPLEQGLEAPPEEDGPPDALAGVLDDLQLGGDEDFSCAAMFSRQKESAELDWGASSTQGGSAAHSTSHLQPLGAATQAALTQLSAKRAAGEKPEFVGLGIGGFKGFETVLAGAPLRSTTMAGKAGPPSLSRASMPPALGRASVPPSFPQAPSAPEVQGRPSLSRASYGGGESLEARARPLTPADIERMAKQSYMPPYPAVPGPSLTVRDVEAHIREAQQRSQPGAQYPHPGGPRPMGYNNNTGPPGGAPGARYPMYNVPPGPHQPGGYMGPASRQHDWPGLHERPPGMGGHGMMPHHMGGPPMGPQQGPRPHPPMLAPHMMSPGPGMPPMMPPAAGLMPLGGAPPQLGGSMPTGPRPGSRAAQNYLPTGQRSDGYVSHQRTKNSSCMTSSEIEEFLAGNWRNVHSGLPYVEDFYYQAWLLKNFRGINVATFKPEKVYQLAPHEKSSDVEHAFANVEGLGKFAYTNLRTPKPLLSIEKAEIGKDAAAEAGGGGSGDDDGGDEVVMKPTEKKSRSSIQADRQVAARKVIEDCSCQLMDVDDIDRMLTAARATGTEKKGERYLLQRRQLLMDNIAETMRITTQLSHAGGAPRGPRPCSDDVFRFLMGFTKGRKFVANTLRRITIRTPIKGTSKRAHGLDLLLAVIRNARLLFSDNVLPDIAGQVVLPEEVHLLLASKELASSASEAISLLERPMEALQCFQALAASDMFSPPSPGSPPDAPIMPLVLLHESLAPVQGGLWFGDVLHKMLEVAHRFRLRGSDLAATYQDCLDKAFDGLMVHLQAVTRMAKEAREMRAFEAMHSLEAMAVPHVLRVLLPECTSHQADQLQSAIHVLMGR